MKRDRKAHKVSPGELMMLSENARSMNLLSYIFPGGQQILLEKLADNTAESGRKQAEEITQ
ncbi:MAG: hypothetical protein IJV88_03005 [Ruminococcus sp.]|nr:hypothetical protein [Ruminococcus sp.]